VTSHFRPQATGNRSQEQKQAEYGEDSARGGLPKMTVKPKSHRDLIVWQKAMKLAIDIYRLAEHFPRQETYRLVDQITRSAASIPANIAEGRSRATLKEFANFLSIAKGSLMETETFLTLAVRLNYVSAEETQAAFSLMTEISKMLTALRRRLLGARGSGSQSALKSLEGAPEQSAVISGP
jgi:four helix bundle protein